MKKLNTLIIAFCFSALTVASVSFATFEGGGGGISLADVIAAISGQFAQIPVVNEFTQGQKINKSGTATNGVRQGLEIRHNEVGSMCIGPSDGQTRSYCFSSNLGVLKLEGGSGTLYDTNTAAHVGLQWNYGGAAPSMMLNQAGTTSVAAGNFLVPETALTVGSNTRTASTFLVDATNDWTKHLPIAAPAASECDAAAEKGRLYFDSTANEFKFCNGTAWTSFGGGGGGGPTTTLDTFPNNADNANIFSDTNIKLSWINNNRRLRLEVLTLPSGTQAGGVDNVGVDISCSKPQGTYVVQVQTEITAAATTTTIADAIQGNNQDDPAFADCRIKAMEDESWGLYEVELVRAAKSSSSADGRLISLKVSKYSY